MTKCVCIISHLFDLYRYENVVFPRKYYRVAHLKLFVWCVGVWLISNTFQKISWDSQSKIHYSFLHFWTYYSFLFYFFFLEISFYHERQAYVLFTKNFTVATTTDIIPFFLFVWKSILLNVIQKYYQRESVSLLMLTCCRASSSFFIVYIQS